MGKYTCPRKGVKAPPALPRAWSTVMPMLFNRFSKAIFLGKKIVATKLELLNAVTRPVACIAPNKFTDVSTTETFHLCF